jgi:hypothetical protein
VTQDKCTISSPLLLLLLPSISCRWAHDALKILLGLIQTGGYSNDPMYANLNPPWLEAMMREGLPEGQELPDICELLCNMLCNMS